MSFDPDLQIDSVKSPKEALEKLRKEEYDYIISDFKMPGMDGIQFAMKIREKSNIPFILYTGQGSEEVAEAAFTVGVTDYLRKEANSSHYQVLARRNRAAVEKHQAENALKESENKYRSFVQSSRDGILVFTGRDIIFANKQAAALLGCSSVEELMKVKPSSRFHPEDRKWIEARALAQERGGDVSPISEIRLVLPDGTERTVESSISVIDYSGRTSTLAFIRDTTERKRMVEVLKESETRFRKVSEFVTDYAYSIRYEPDGSKWVSDYGFPEWDEEEKRVVRARAT